MIFRPFFIPAPTFSTPQKNISTLQRLHASTFLHSYIFTFSFFIFNFFGRAPRRKRLRVGLSALTRRIQTVSLISSLSVIPNS